MESESAQLHSEISGCQNCGQELKQSDKYCPACGQKVGSALIPLKSLFGEFIGTVLNLDSKIFKTLRYLFVPGFLTREFIQGRRISYFQPLRLYFTTLVLLYAVLGLLYLGDLERNITSDNSSEEYIAISQARSMLEKSKTRIGYDTLPSGQRAGIDSLFAHLNVRTPTMSIARWSTKGESAIKIPINDIYELELDSICVKYGITDFADRLIAKQYIRAHKEPAKLVRSMIANTSWMLLLIVPALAFVMKLLYLRRKKYYVEHLAFLCHYQAAVCVCLTFYLLVFTFAPLWLHVVIPVFCLLFLLVAIKAYYKQGWFRSIMKYFALLTAYVLCLIVFTGITALVSWLTY